MNFSIKISRPKGFVWMYISTSKDSKKKQILIIEKPLSVHFCGWGFTCGMINVSLLLSRSVKRIWIPISHLYPQLHHWDTASFTLRIQSRSFSVKFILNRNLSLPMKKTIRLKSGQLTIFGVLFLSLQRVRPRPAKTAKKVKKP